MALLAISTTVFVVIVQHQSVLVTYWWHGVILLVDAVFSVLIFLKKNQLISRGSVWAHSHNSHLYFFSSTISYSSHPHFIQTKRCRNVFVQLGHRHNQRRSDQVDVANFNAAGGGVCLWVFHIEEANKITSKIYRLQLCIQPRLVDPRLF